MEQRKAGSRPFGDHPRVIIVPTIIIPCISKFLEMISNKDEAKISGVSRFAGKSERSYLRVVARPVSGCKLFDLSPNSVIGLTTAIGRSRLR